MGATNRFKLSRVLEVTKGTTPASPAFKEIRITSDGLVATPTRTTSNEIRSDRQVTDQILTKIDAAGPLGIEASFSAHDDEIEAALQGTWANNPSITVVTTDTEISDVSTTTLTTNTGLGTPFKAGMLCYTFGFNTSANNGLLARVASSGSTSIVFPAATFTAESNPIQVGAGVRVVGFQGASGDITATSTGLASTSLDFTTLGLNAGQWVKIGGDAAGNQFATAALNSYARISGAAGAIAAHALTFDILPTGWTTDAGTGKTVEVFMGDFVKNGTTQRGFTYEGQQQDLTSPSFEYFPGQQVDGLSYALKAGAVVTGTINLIGQGLPSPLTTRASGATDIAAPTFPVLNAANNIGRLMMNGTVVSSPSYMMELGLDIKNNLAGQGALNSLTPVGIRDGEVSVSGPISQYFGDLTSLNAVLNDTDTSIMFRMGRLDGNRESLMFDVPAVKLTGTAPVSGKNQDRMFTGSYAAKKHATLGFTVSCSRFWYLPVAS